MIQVISAHLEVSVLLAPSVLQADIVQKVLAVQPTVLQVPKVRSLVKVLPQHATYAKKEPFANIRVQSMELFAPLIIIVQLAPPIIASIHVLGALTAN